MVMSSSRSAHRCSALVSWARVGSDAVSGGSPRVPARSIHPLSEDQRRVAEAGGCGCGPGARRAARSLGVGTPLAAGADGAPAVLAS
nr:hypothetical protein [Streptomyces tsukubensis NRRL18488]